MIHVIKWKDRIFLIKEKTKCIGLPLYSSNLNSKEIILGINEVEDMKKRVDKKFNQIKED